MEKGNRKIIPIREIIGDLFLEAFFKDKINGFCCRDKDVEDFLKLKAFDFDNRNKSRTYLVYEGEELVAYFTLSIHALVFGESTSKTAIKKIDGYSNEVGAVGLILIGQLGKDINLGININGSELLELCFKAIKQVQNVAGGRYVMLECQDIPKLVEFYEGNGFKFLQKDEKDKYLQLVRKL